MALTAEQTQALTQDETFRLRCVQQLVILAHAALAAGQGEMTDEQYERYLKRALRLVRDEGVADLFITRIIKTLVGATAIQAADTDPGDASDVTDGDLKDAIEYIVLAINAYEDYTNEVVV